MSPRTSWAAWTAASPRCTARRSYRAAKTAGYLYQAQLRATISERLGLEWGAVRNGAAELAGVPVEILTEFSKRRQVMLRAAELGGISLDTKVAGPIRGRLLIRA